MADCDSVAECIIQWQSGRLFHWKSGRMCHLVAEWQTVIQWQNVLFSGRMCYLVAEWQNVLLSSRVAECVI